ncbi:ABC-2 type transport system permease protein [Geomicrobium halophilum]|uniref:ABC-2 type transport system permease protein n=1 Tax=Geomicrobium halophilum TaxID=549000 RepID=A0A841PW75_9BACL|nr:ABC transporter permease [Geomicrobium halophilum]MBB6448533.1 ABC-2 type transport system permease protein [Geomicrobium halophilum]
MNGLLQNEWVKAWYGRKIWMFLIAMFVFLILGWAFAAVIHSVGRFSIGPMEFVEPGLVSLNVFINLYTVVLVTTAIAGEYGNGTMKQQLIRPVPREQLLLSKWLITMLIATALIFILTIALLVIDQVYFTSGESFFAMIYEAFILALYQLPRLVFYISLATLMAVLTRSTALTLVITFFPYFFGNIIGAIAMLYDWSHWLVLTHLDVYQNYAGMGGGPPFENIWLSVGFIGIHAVVFLLLAHLIFQYRDVV